MEKIVPEVKRLPSSFGIRFGILNPSIAKQIKAQGLKFDIEKAKEFDRMRNAIYDLSFGGLLVDSQIDKLFVKLYNKILRHVGTTNKCNVKPLTNKK